MFVCMSVSYGFTIEIYGFMHSLRTFLPRAAHDAITCDGHVGISLCTDIAHVKKIAGLPQIWILTLSLRNSTPRILIAYTREYATHQGKRELVSMVSV